MNRLFKKISAFVENVKSDYHQTVDFKNKYSEFGIRNDPSASDTPSILKLFATNIGFQSIVVIRAMQLARDLSIPFGGEVLSRLIRHLYGMEIHWQADIAPGISLVHGNGIVISKAAKVNDGCLLFQNVTLGHSRNPKSGEVGAPTVERNVHIGPGATLLGPITVGEGSKIMAGAVLAQSVPANSVVKPAEASIQSRT